MFESVAQELNFRGNRATELVARFGSPLYLYDEGILRGNCRRLKGLTGLDNLTIYYSAKANSNVELLKIIREEGLCVDAMSQGELAMELAAGFEPRQILLLGNNLKTADFAAAKAAGVSHVCLDSADQIRRYAQVNPGACVAVRVNPAQGAGHHKKVVTAGKVKFGIDPEQLPAAFELAAEVGIQITGLMLHIGSLFLDPQPWLSAMDFLLELANDYPSVTYLDFGGGLGIPYDRTQAQPFPLKEFGVGLETKIKHWLAQTGRQARFALEPGRFVVAEAGAILCEVQSLKTNCGVNFAGTDLGFNFLLRPELYGAYHEIIKASNLDSGPKETYQIAGNVCESGDHLGNDRSLCRLAVGDLLLVRDTGAYGYAMSSNYNGMPRPAEVLIGLDGQARLIRRRETIQDLLQTQSPERFY